MAKRTCSIEGCEKPHCGKGWCLAHYKRWRRHGDPLAGNASPSRGKQCTVEGCERPRHARGYCTMHWQRWDTHGDPLKVVLPPKPQTCSIKDCGRRAVSGGLCNGHNHRLRKTGDVLADVPLAKKRRGIIELCSVDGCMEKYSAKGLCKKHYMEARAQRLAAEGCVVDGCDRVRATTDGYCTRHYQRVLQYGDPLSGGPQRRLRGTGNRWEHEANRRAAKAKMSQVSGETAEYVTILRRDPCAYCGAPCEHIDHVIPFADGGVTDWTNLAPACASCNYKKSRKSLLAFLLERATVEVEELAA